MLCLIYMISVLILNQSLYLLINAQHDLQIKPIVWKYSPNQFISNNSQSFVTPNFNKLNIKNNYQRQNASFDTHYNIPQSELYQALTSYYYTLAPVDAKSIKENIKLRDKYNGNHITEQRSRNIPSKVQSPIELHYGYRYTSPAIYFSNYTNLNNVIYNELGLSENYSGLTNLPKGFELHQPQTEFHIKHNLVPGNINSATEDPFHSKNLNYQKSTNTTILIPVKNLIFSYNYSQLFDINSPFKKTDIFRQPSLNHTLNTVEKMETQFNKKTSNSTGHNKVFNLTSNVYTLPLGEIPQDLKTGNITPENTFVTNKNYPVGITLNTANTNRNQIFINNQIVTNSNNKDIFPNLQPHLTADGEQNELFFTKNVFLAHSSNVVSKLPMESNRYHYSKTKESNGNTQVMYPEQNHNKKPFFNNYGQNNSYKLVYENYKNQISPLQIVSPPNRRIPQDTLKLNHFNFINSFNEQLRVRAEIINEKIDPRAANYRKEFELQQPEQLPKINKKIMELAII